VALNRTMKQATYNLMTAIYLAASESYFQHKSIVLKVNA
jgi:hypothetical protein